MRLPKLRGGSAALKTTFSVVHLSDLEKLATQGVTTITPEVLKESGYVRGRKTLVKVLSSGTLSHAVTLSVHAMSASAQSAVEKAGGSVTLLS